MKRFVHDCLLFRSTDRTARTMGVLSWIFLVGMIVWVSGTVFFIIYFST